MDNTFSLTKDEAKEVLKTVAQSLHDAIIGGFSDYKIYDSERAVIHDKTVKSNLVRSYVLNRVKQLVANNPSLKLIEQKRMFAILVSDKIVIRFKKLNNIFRSSNIPTKQANEFRSRILTFKGVRALPIDAGWRVNEFYSEIEDVHFVCPNGIGNLWRFPLEDLAVQKIQTVMFPKNEEEIIQVVTVKTEIAHVNRKTAN
jgi:hypothetical protein